METLKIKSKFPSSKIKSPITIMFNNKHLTNRL